MSKRPVTSTHGAASGVFTPLYNPWVAATLIVALGVALAIVAAIWVQGRNQDLANARFEALTSRVGGQISERLAKYEYAVRGARGAVIAAGGTRITRATFHEYSKTRDIRHEFPGTRGFGFIERVAPGNEASFLARSRREGVPLEAIKQIQPHEGEHWLIRYVEPSQGNSAAIGLDVASEKNRRDAALNAMQTGRASLTAPIALVQAQGGGFLLFLPIYRAAAPISTPAERQRALIGWSYAVLGIADVLGGFDPVRHDYDVAITDLGVTGARPFFQTAVQPTANAMQRDIVITPFDRSWRVHVVARPSFIVGLHLTSPLTVGFVTFLLSLIPAGLVWMRGATRRREYSSSIGRARLAAIVAGSNDAIIGKTLDGTVTDWNPAAERLFGISAEAAIGQQIAALIVPPHLQDEETKTLARLRNGESTPHLMTQRLRSDGTMLSALVSVSPILARDGTVVGAATTVRDITQQLAAEENIRQLNATLEKQVLERTAQLKQSTVLQSAILNYAGYAVIATDPEGTITLFNPAAEAMVGYTAEELVGKRSPGVFHDPDEVVARAAALSAEFDTVIEPGFEVFIHRTKRGLPNVETWTYVTKNGDKLPVQLNISPLRTDEGEEIGFLGIAIDLTDRLRREDELEAAKVAAERAAAAKAEFLATMSHELRTPLNSVVGFSRLMLEGGELTTPSLQRQARLVHDSSRTLLSVVNDVLDVSKLDSGRLDLDPRPFSLRHLVESTADMLRTQILDKGLTIDIELPQALPAMLIGDDGRLRQILLNLLSNAVKFTAKGSVRLRVEQQPAIEGRLPLRISVQDTGIGIPQAKRHRLFGRFSQADGSTSREYGGTGLGLSISKSLVEIMGGTIGFDTEEGKGSTFWIAIELPIAADQTVVSTANIDNLPTAGRPLKILLAEDVEINQELAIAFIGRWGHQVDVASNGAAAVDAVQRDHYDLVLMDVQMPVMDGVEATQRIRASAGAHAAIPIVAMTANVLSDDLARFRAAGMNDHVGKPFDPAQLHAVIERWRPESARDDSAVDRSNMSVAAVAPVVTLAQKYRDRREASKQTFIALRSALGTSPADETFREIKGVAHQLAGVAGMFGESDVGDLAAAAETAIDNALETPASEDAARLASDALDTLIRKLEGE